MKPKSLKLKIQPLAQSEMQNTKGGAKNLEQLKTVICTGKKKEPLKMF